MKVNQNGKPIFEAFTEFKTLREWISDPRCVVNKATLEKRLFGGWTLEEALSVRPGETGSHGQNQVVHAFGEEKTLEAWGFDERSRVPIVVIRQRLDNGYSPEEAIATPGLSFADSNPQPKVIRKARAPKAQLAKAA